MPLVVNPINAMNRCSKAQLSISWSTARAKLYNSCAIHGKTHVERLFRGAKGSGWMVLDIKLEKLLVLVSYLAPPAA